MELAGFRKIIWSWYRAHGRHNLPWRRARDPYRILVSEIMLQQTQVSRVIPKYREFLSAFPSIRALDRAPLGRVLAVWQGMGYNRRVAYLKRLAHIILETHGGRIPADPAILCRLPGIGRATAGAVAAYAYNRRVAFVETNIRRVYLHHFFPNRRNVRDREILPAVLAALPEQNVREWYWALTDYGALALKGAPNPNRRSAHYARQPAFAGSRRELRGKVLAIVLAKRAVPLRTLERMFPGVHPVSRIVRALASEGLVAQRDGTVRIPRRDPPDAGLTP